MAVNYATQTQTTAFENRLPLYGAGQPSPASMTSSPSNISPTSPRIHGYMNYQLPSQIRQIRPPKTPLYVPAVLRPTEYPSKTSPPTPPKSLHGSFETLEDADLEAEIIRRATEEGRTPQEIVAEQGSWLGEEELGDVTGLPTRDHWKPDAASPTCDSPKCRSSFNLFVRKHHCRHCGHIFCSTHTPHTIPLDQQARFHPEGNQSRACEHCYHAYRRWDIARSLSRKNSQASSGKASDGGSSAPQFSRGISFSAGKPAQEAAQSVPKDWQWSTF